MLLLFFLSSSLFLGWSLGANDAANVFGSAVGSKMLNFRKAAMIASVFVVFGAVSQGRGPSTTLMNLGAVDALAGAFTISLCTALAVLFMTKYGMPVSTSQAVVGAIIGWAVFTGYKTDYNVLSQIIGVWLVGPILGLLISALLFLLLRYYLRKARIHVIKQDAYIRYALIITGAFAAYSLGANNIANVMGVFVGSVPAVILNFGFFTLDGVQMLFLIGGLSIAVGIFTYSERVMNTLGNSILSLTPEAAVVVVLSQALVLFIFSSGWLSQQVAALGLPAIPLVPVSSTQVVVGSVIGIGLVKGAREINTKTLGHIALGWITTPMVAGFLTFITLFFVQNVFRLQVSAGKAGIVDYSSDTISHRAESSIHKLNVVLPGILILSFIIIVVLVFLFYKQRKLKLKAEHELLNQQNEFYETRKQINKMEVSAIHLENNLLSQKLEAKRRENINIALNISAQREFLNTVAEKLEALKCASEPEISAKQLHEVISLLRQKMNFNDEMEHFYAQIENIHKDFQQKLAAAFPGLSNQERRLCILLRLNLSFKEISALQNISPKSVEIARYRLRKKINLGQGENLTAFLQNL